MDEVREEDNRTPPDGSEITPKPKDPGSSKEQGEIIHGRRLSVKIDHSKLKQIETIGRGRVTTEEEQGNQELQGMLERISRLPEKLEFRPGITLIVGENGSGKTTLGKALYLAASIRNHERLYSDLYPDDPEGLKQAARESVFNAGPYQDIWLSKAGLASQISVCLDAEFPENVQLTAEYLDPAELKGREGTIEEDSLNRDYQQRREQEMIAEKMGRSGSSPAERFRPSDRSGGSHRQYVDQVLISRLSEFGGSLLARDKSLIVFIDEPETGMDPIRHKRIIGELLDRAPKKAILIIPTNSVVFYDSDLPRIDLSQPERGIHQPSQSQ